MALNIAEAGGKGVAAVAGKKIAEVIFQSYNPSYNKENARRMRYIQRKYAQAYGMEAGEDLNKTISDNDPHSKLKMSPRGFHPANPFPDERAYDDALTLNTAPVRGHMGRFAASHAHAIIGKTIQYQVQRRARHYIPGVSGHGKANDYINMFLEELKAWCRNQLSLDQVNEDELTRREQYFQLLKHDNYYWCFPPDASHHDHTLHAVIDFSHNRVKDALEIVKLESKNKSLHQMFKDLNDHTSNSFQYGQRFLAYLLYSEEKGGADLLSSPYYTGATYQTGKLQRILEKATASVAREHLIGADGKTQMRLESVSRAEGNQIGEPPLLIEGMTNGPALLGNGQSTDEDPSGRRQGCYDVTVTRIPTGVPLRSSDYEVSIISPKGSEWVVTKKFADFDKLYEDLKEVCRSRGIIKPIKKGSVGLNEADYRERCEALQTFISDLLNCLHKFPTEVKKNLLADFLEVAMLEEPLMVIVPAESQENQFKNLQETFNELVGRQLSKKEKDKNKDLLAMKDTWGAQTFLKILEAHALLQRMATILGWTLEISHFFVSMFGNTLAFSKLPLADVLATQKNIMMKFIAISNELYLSACEINAEKKYQWHKNLNMVESYKKTGIFHMEAAIKVINSIETEHLDYEAQVKRLKDVMDRFGPLMKRLDMSIPQIQNELDLPKTALRAEQKADRLQHGSSSNINLLVSGIEMPNLEDKISGSKESKNTYVEEINEQNELVWSEETPQVAESKLQEDVMVKSKKEGSSKGSSVCAVS